MESASLASSVAPVPYHTRGPVLLFEFMNAGHGGFFSRLILLVGSGRTAAAFTLFNLGADDGNWPFAVLVPFLVTRERGIGDNNLCSIKSYVTEGCGG